jgi:hypothetical protein
LVFLLLLTLVGCSDGNGVLEQSTEKVVKSGDQTEKTVPSKKKDVYVPNPQITDDIKLVDVGETVTDRKGELRLRTYKLVNETINVGAVEMLIKDIKVMHFVPDYSMIDFFHGYTHDEEFDFVKVSIELKNSSNEIVKFTPIAALKMNNGEHKTWEDDIYLEELTGSLVATDVKKGNMGFILENTDDLKSLELLTSDVVDKENKVSEHGKHIIINF